MMKIKKVAIFGGNGTVGSLMGGLIAGFGNAQVYLISRDKSKLNEDLLDRIYSSIKSDSIDKKIILCDYGEAKLILGQCDWIFESVSEDYDIKESVYQIINELAKKDAIITTGTSGLSINQLSNPFSDKRKKYFFGTHFFNPPYHMSLCEIVTTKYNDMGIINEFKEYLENSLLRTTVVSKDEPAFIANRIGFKLMNDLLLLAEKYKQRGGIDYIDSLFTGYTGRNMSPLKTIDFVGLDIHKAIVDNIYLKTQDEFKNSFKLPDWFNLLIQKGILGKKTQKGLYQKTDQEMVFDITRGEYRPKEEFHWKEIQEIQEDIKIGKYVNAYYKLLKCSTEEIEIVVKTLIEYIVYALYIGKNTANKIEDCDDAMATGFGWCPPIALKDLIEESAGNFTELCTKYIGQETMNKYDLYSLIKEVPKSKYDYRKYIKAI